ncbi:hypothetical protein HYW75_04145 [Candidatus Pacearchaeota archaeon]|nr:hypothetical protein [Candidatus Pacearchaeota archaeon]
MIQDTSKDLTAIFQERLEKDTLELSAIAAVDLFQLISRGEYDSESGKNKVEHYAKILPKLRELCRTSGEDVAGKLEKLLVEKNFGTNGELSRVLEYGEIRQLTNPQINTENKDSVPAIKKEGENGPYRGITPILLDMGVSSGIVNKATAYIIKAIEENKNEYLERNHRGKVRRKFIDNETTRAIFRGHIEKGGFPLGEKVKKDIKYISLTALIYEFKIPFSKRYEVANYIRSCTSNEEYLKGHSIPWSRGLRYEDTSETRDHIKKLLQEGKITSDENQKNDFSNPDRKDDEGILQQEDLVPYSPLKIEQRTGISFDFIESNAPSLLEVKNSGPNKSKCYDPKNLQKLVQAWENRQKT